MIAGCSTRATRVLRAVAVAGMAAGALGVAGWVRGDPTVLFVSRDVTIAPFTALAVALLSLALLLLCLPRAGPRAVRTAVLLAAVLGTVSLVSLVGAVAGASVSLERPLDWAAPLLPWLADEPPSRPGADTAIALLGASLVLLVVPRGRRWAGLCATAAAALGFLECLGYLYATPLLFGESVVPISLPSAVLVLLLGAALTTAAGTGVLPLRVFAGPSSRALLLRWFLPVVAAVVLVVDFTTGVVFMDVSPALASALSTLLLIAAVGAVVIPLSQKVGAELDRAQADLRSRSNYERGLIEASLDPLVTISAAGKITDVNAATEAATGVARAELIGSDFSDYFTEPARARAGYQAVFARGLVLDYPLTIRHRSGTTTDVLYNARVYRNPAGAVQGVFAAARDVTEVKRAERELQRSEAEFRGLVERSPFGVYRSTRAGRYVMVNPALVRMLGYDSAEELLRLDVGRDVYADPAERERLIRDAPPVSEVEWKRRDGKRIAVRLSTRGIPDAGADEACFEGMVEDVTEQRRLEGQVRQAQRLEAVGRLAGGVAHDFNNVLTAIIGYCDLLLEGLGPENPARPDVQEIKAAALRAASLTQQLLAFSRRQVLQTQVLDLNGVVEGLEKMLHRLIGEDVRLELALASPVGAIRADPGQLEQVLVNLAVNARDAMPAGGTLTIETAAVELDDAYARAHPGASPGPYTMLAVTDTGTGMDAETRAHIFEPFFTTKEKGVGTGLGLATVYGIVQQSGGFIWVYSEPGHGATFKIYLPTVLAASEARGAAAAEGPAAGGDETVLLVEDDTAVREVAAQVLAQKGYRVLCAPDGRTALAMARARPGEIQILVTDIVMPGMSGRELADALLAIRPRVRVLYTSGYTDDVIVRRGVLEEGMPYLQKPFTPAVLARKVREVLDRR